MQTIRDRIALVGCAVALLAAGTLLVLAGRTALLWLVWLAVITLGALDGLQRWRLNALVKRFRRQHGATKDLLIIYTASPHWQPRIEGEWGTRWRDRAVLLNRSEPWDHEQVEARLWQTLGGRREHTPLAVVIPRRGGLTVVRFFFEFGALKHGKPGLLFEAEARLQQALDASQAIDAA